ncbi:hypothetical protein niasHT_007521 [Heterodera trifolii]|uniref:FAD/NAD(P)-binding domain-containing protein n=1 Tax=Heterodera trifolii TaxID=157864 RepID=A0ABD2LPT9_9BILA
MQFKTKTLTAHINGRKHRETLSKLKDKDNSLKKAKETSEVNAINSRNSAETDLKRKHPNGIDVADNGRSEKKIKQTEDEAVIGGQTKVPWQAEVRNSEREETEKNVGANVIEGVPKGFFDDQQMNSRVRETIEKQKKITSEIDRFYKEVEELEVQREDEHEELNEQSALRSDIEMIDEQIERWKMVNELEKKKENIVESVATKFEQKPNFDPVEIYYASLSIRARDPDARVLIITDEQETPYKRGPLSKELWWFADDASIDSLSHTNPTSSTGRRRYAFYEADGFYLPPDKLDEWEHGGVGLIRGAKVVKVDTEGSFVLLDDGRKIEFGKCLIATGSDALLHSQLERLPELDDFVTTLGKASDFRKIYSKVDKMAVAENGTQNVIVVLGGGLLGTELAYSLNRRYARDQEKPAVKIVQLCQETGILSEILPDALSDYSTDMLRYQGIDVLTDTRIDSASVKGRDEKRRRICLNTTAATTSDGPKERKQIMADFVIIALGAEPNIELADEKGGIKLDKANGGVMTDEHLRVCDNVWAAGDVCSFVDPILKRRRRCTHWQHAQITGRIAGENMTDGHKTYTHQGAFVTMFGPYAHICGVGDVNPHSFSTTTIFAKRDEEAAEDAEDELRAVVFYTEPTTNVVVGVLLYNILGMGEEWARKLIRDAQRLDERTAIECAKLFELWDSEDDEENKKREKEGTKTAANEERANAGGGKLTEVEVEAYQRRED